MIGHTQPRRIAARSIAERVAEELGTTLGGPVGYKVRFTDRVSDATLIKLMTDGVLLAELHGDPELRNYDTLIIDEAHERSLNIDFILGYLKRLFPSRPDLKVIITRPRSTPSGSPSISTGAPVIEVPGRTYPVEIRYRPLDEPDEDGNDDEPMDEVQAVCEAVAELCREGPGDILVFLPGEREIRDTAEALAKADVRGLEVLALYGRLSSAEQHRIFEPHTRSPSVPVHQCGRNFSHGAGYPLCGRPRHGPHLALRPADQSPAAAHRADIPGLGQPESRGAAAASARAYAYGFTRRRTSPARRPFTEPEILRTNLASVILQMAAIGLGDIENFPFMEPPDRRNIKDGIALLEELGRCSAPSARRGGSRRHGAPATAATVASASAAIGRKLAQLAARPEARADGPRGRARPGAWTRSSLLPAGLSVQDPRERPAEKREAADRAARPVRRRELRLHVLSYTSGITWTNARPSSVRASSAGCAGRSSSRTSGLESGRTFMVNWPKYAVRSASAKLPSARSRPAGGGRARLGRATIGTGQIGTGQIGTGNKGQPRAANDPRAAVHQALLSGLVTQVGVREGDRTDFAGPRNARFAIWPGSVLAKKSPRWVMAAELVETGRLWAAWWRR